MHVIFSARAAASIDPLAIDASQQKAYLPSVLSDRTPSATREGRRKCGVLPSDGDEVSVAALRPSTAEEAMSSTSSSSERNLAFHQNLELSIFSCSEIRSRRGPCFVLRLHAYTPHLRSVFTLTCCSKPVVVKVAVPTQIRNGIRVWQSSMGHSPISMVWNDGHNAYRHPHNCAQHNHPPGHRRHEPCWVAFGLLVFVETTYGIINFMMNVLNIHMESAFHANMERHPDAK